MELAGHIHQSDKRVWVPELISRMVLCCLGTCIPDLDQIAFLSQLKSLAPNVWPKGHNLLLCPKVSQVALSEFANRFQTFRKINKQTNKQWVHG